MAASGLATTMAEHTTLDRQALVTLTQSVRSIQSGSATRRSLGDVTGWMPELVGCHCGSRTATGCRPRLSGNMPAGQGRRRNIHSVMTSYCWKRTAGAVGTRDCGEVCAYVTQLVRPL